MKIIGFAKIGLSQGREFDLHCAPTFFLQMVQKSKKNRKKKSKKKSKTKSKKNAIALRQEAKGEFGLSVLDVVFVEHGYVTGVVEPVLLRTHARVGTVVLGAEQQGLVKAKGRIRKIAKILEI